MTESAYLNELLLPGTLRIARECLLLFVQGRFPAAITPDVEQAINDQSSLPVLREWMKAAAASKDAEEFLAVIRR